jgi:Flp pilus assembly protein TadG
MLRDEVDASSHAAPKGGAAGRALRVPSPLRRPFRRNSDGAVAVEFALLAIPFLALILAIFQTSMVYITGQVLQTAVTDASRLIMTGQAQSQSFDASKFKAAVCSRVTAMFNCSQLLQVDVKVYSSFTGASVTTPPVSGGSLDTSSFGFNAGSSNDIVVVRGVIAYPVIIPFVAKSYINLSNNRVLIMASAAFKNEPF